LYILYFSLEDKKDKEKLINNACKLLESFNYNIFFRIVIY